MVVALTAARTAGGEVVIDTSFGQTGRTAGQPRTGRLPKGWSGHTSGSAKAWPYSVGEEAGRNFLKAAMTREDGQAEMGHGLPRLGRQAYWRLTFSARSPVGSAIQVGIRDVAPPYQFAWEVRPYLGERWKHFAYDFQVSARAKPVRFYVILHGVGEVHLADLKLIRRTRKQLIEEIEAKNPDGGPKNLMRVTRPFRLQDGWMLGNGDTDADAVRPAVDETAGAPGGAPVMRLESATPFELFSSPFEVARPTETHTGSVYLKGSGSGKVSVLGDGRVLASTEFTLEGDGQWHRVEVPFTPVLLARTHAILISGSGTVAVDAFQVNRGKTATEFVTQYPCEVALLPADDTRLDLDDGQSPPHVVVKVLGDETADRRVRARVTHADGRTMGVEPMRLPGEGPDDPLVIPYALPFGDRRYGSYRIEAWVETADGKLQSPVSEITVHFLRRPRYWGKDAPGSPFGVHTNSTRQHIAMAKAVGINWVRLHDAGTPYIGWRYLEKKRGKWTFRDADLNRYREGGLKILGAFATAPDWASHIDKPRMAYFDQFYQPRDLSEYANYVKVVAERYKGVIDSYDVWNEPWNHRWWAVRYDERKTGRDGYTTSEHAQADFARLTKVAWETAKGVDPSIKVLGVNSTTGGRSKTQFGGEEWTRGVVQAGGVDACDVVCYHQYTSEPQLFPGDAAEKGLAAATRPIVRRFGKLPKPVWMTEGSASRGRIGNGLYQQTLPEAARDQEDVIGTSDATCRYVISLLANGVAKVFLYSMHAHWHFGRGNDFRTLVTEDGYLHPSAGAFSAMTWHLEDTRFAKRLSVAQDVYAYLLSGERGAVAVIAAHPGKRAQYALPAVEGAQLEDLFGNRIVAGEALGRTVVYLSLDGEGALAKLESALAGAGGPAGARSRNNLRR